MLHLCFAMKTRVPRPGPLTSDEPVPGDPRSEFGKKLRAARIRAGLTQAEVAEQAGLTQQYVSVVEGGRQNITLSTMKMFGSSSCPSLFRASPEVAA
jgi:DNA-binding XRE family transcriptional regulator